MASELEVGEIVGLISAAYPNFAPTKHTVKVYFETLKDLDADELNAAAMKCITEVGRKFAPSVGELRGAVAEIRRSISGLPSSYEAWQEVHTQLLENGGDFGNPVFSHPLIERAVKALGWRNLRFSDNMTADRARFVQVYEQFERRAMTDEMELPNVRAYIENMGGRQLPSSQVKMLADKLRK